MRVFISYRRDDSMVTAALLYRELTSRSEFADAFMDIRNIGYGDGTTFYITLPLTTPASR